MRRVALTLALFGGLLWYGSACPGPTDGENGRGGGGGGGGGDTTHITYRWISMDTPPLEGRQNHVAATAQGKIFVGLGRNDITFFRDWWAFDPSTGTWTRKADFPENPREFPFVFVINGSIYVGGGRDLYGYVRKDVFRYDPATDTWTQVSSLSAPRWGAAGASDGQYGYVLGGSLSDSDYGPYSDELLRYDPATNTWEVIDHFPVGPRWIPFMAYHGGALYAGGGLPSNGLCSPTLLKFDLATGQWSAAADLPAGLYDGWAIATPSRILVLGGHVDCPPNQCTSHFYVYDPATDSWDFLPDFPAGGRNNLIGGAMGDTLFVGLGDDCSGYVVDWWKLEPSSATF